MDAVGAIIGGTSGASLIPGGALATGPAGALLGYKMVDVGVTPLKATASVFGWVSTGCTALSDVLTNDTYIEGTLSLNLHHANLEVDGFIGQDTYVSSVISGASQKYANSAPAALAMQTLAVANDYGVLRDPALGLEIMEKGSEAFGNGNSTLGRSIWSIGYLQNGFSTWFSNKLPKTIPISKKFELW